MTRWPTSETELEEVQLRLASAAPPLWRFPENPLIGGVWFTAPTGSALMTSAEWSWAAAVALDDRGPVAESVVRGRTGAGYRAGYLALREGPLLDESIRSLGVEPDVVLVNATGLDHPRGAGLALHLGAVVGIPTVGVTDRPLLSGGPPPGPERFATSPLFIDGKQVAAYLRSRRGARPIVVHPAWRTDVRTAIEVVGAFVWRARTPEPLRLARRAARLARARDEGRLS